MFTSVYVQLKVHILIICGPGSNSIICCAYISLGLGSQSAVSRTVNDIDEEHLPPKL